MIFPSVEFVRNVINKQGRQSTLAVVLDCTHIYGADFTAARVVDLLMQDFKERNQKLIFYNLQPRVAKVFEGINSDFVSYYDINALEAELTESDDSKL